MKSSVLNIENQRKQLREIFVYNLSKVFPAALQKLLNSTPQFNRHYKKTLVKYYVCVIYLLLIRKTRKPSYEIKQINPMINNE